MEMVKHLLAWIKRNKFRSFLIFILLSIYGLFLYTPYEYDIIPRRKTNPGSAKPDQDGFWKTGACIMVVTAHPDDAEFFLSGVFAKLQRTKATIQLVVCTDGDKGYYPFGNFGQAAELAKVRRAEQTLACKTWGGLPPTFLGYPDGRLSMSKEVEDRLLDEMNKFRPDYILAFDGDYPPQVSHRDHRRSGLHAQAAAHRYGKAKWLMRFSTSSPNFIVDISDETDSIRKFVAIHESQFKGEKLNGVVNMILDSAMTDGEKGDFTFGVGLRCEPHP